LPTLAGHHLGLIVSDIERARQFYVGALGGKALNTPTVFSGPTAEFVMGQEGCEFALCLIAFDEGAVELFSFVSDDRPPWTAAPRAGRVPHLGIRVDDVAATTALIERFGGKKLWDHEFEIGGGKVMYAADPDGNVLEIVDITVECIAQALIAETPQAAPTA
jgi:catechol 2,3-dioxygenase-like lactoylglutathione lyase family enzyme